MSINQHNENSFVVFSVKNRIYAVNAKLVKEIGDPLHTIQIPKLPQTLSGVMRYRDRVIPVVNLDVVFDSLHDAKVENGIEPQLIVLQVDQAMAGIVVDRVLEMESTDKQVDPMPFAAHKEISQLCQGVIQGRHGVEIVLDVQALFSALSIDKQTRSLEQASSTIKKEQRYSVFSMRDDLFCVPIQDVKRIVAADQIEELPDMPSIVRGIYSTDDDEVPTVVINCYQAFSITEPAIKEDEFFDIIERNVILLEFEDRKIGFYVGPITKIVTISDSSIFPLARVAQTRNNVFLRAVAIVEDQLVNVVDLSRIMELDELNNLRQNA